MHTRVDAISRKLPLWAATAGAAALALAAASSTADAQVRCGDVVGPGVEVVLQGDLECDDVENGITILGPAVLDLNGFSIRCADRNGNGRAPAIGLAVVGRGGAVRNGTVDGCRTGVLVAGDGFHRVTEIAVVASAGVGVRLASADNRVSACAASSSDVGFAIDGRYNVVSENDASGNDVGFRVAERNVVSANVATANEKSGFVVSGRGSSLRRNRAVENRVGFTVFGQRNRFGGNAAEGNLTGFFLDGRSGANLLAFNVASRNLFAGVSGAGSGNVLYRTRADENGGHGIRLGRAASATKVSRTTSRGNPQGDLVDDTSGCGTNRWSSNVFGSANQPCIE